MVFNKKANGPLIDPLIDPENGHFFARAIIDTVRDSLIILDENLRVLAASKSFYDKFDLDFESINGKMFYDLENGQWDIPALRALLEGVIINNKPVENFEVNHKFNKLGDRTILINAKHIAQDKRTKIMLLSIIDVTEQRKLEKEKEMLSHQKDILLKEMRHRIANSLQIIASILLLKAQEVTSEETRSQLEDVHDRVMSIATVQGHLDPSGLGSDIDVASYLNALCKSLERSMIGNRRPLSIKVNAGPGKVTTDEAIGFGLITTELVINAIKHAFNPNAEGTITVTYKSDKLSWELSVKDNGSGMSKDTLTRRKGLGSGIVDTLVKQLKATIKTDSDTNGTTVSISRK